MRSGQLHHLEFYVGNLARAVEFWGWFLPRLGYEPFQAWPEGRSWRHLTGTYLVFMQVKAEFLSLKNNRQAAGLNHLAFYVDSSESFLSMAEELASRPVKILSRQDSYLCFEHVNGFAVELYGPSS